MIIYKDIITDDEIISDTYDLKDIDDAVYEVDCKMVTVGGALNINIGANAAEQQEDGEDGEKADEGVEDAPAQVNNVIDAFRLNQMPPYTDKEDFVKSVKAYLKRLSAALKERGVDEEKITKISDGIKKYAAKKMASKIKDFEPYVGESFDVEHAMPIHLNYRADGETPYFTIWKHGLREMKV